MCICSCRCLRNTMNQRLRGASLAAPLPSSSLLKWLTAVGKQAQKFFFVCVRQSSRKPATVKYRICVFKGKKIWNGEKLSFSWHQKRKNQTTLWANVITYHKLFFSGVAIKVLISEQTLGDNFGTWQLCRYQPEYGLATVQSWGCYGFTAPCVETSGGVMFPICVVQSACQLWLGETLD